MLEEDQTSTRKRVKFYEQDDESMVSFKTTDYVKGSNDISSITGMETDNPSNLQSARDSQQSSEPK